MVLDSPAEILSNWFVQAHVLRWESDTGNPLWPVTYSDGFPSQGPSDLINNRVACFDVSGKIEGRYMRGGQFVIKHGVTIMVRGESSSMSYRKAADLIRIIERIKWGLVDLRGNKYQIQSVCLVVPITHLYQDKNRREVHSFHTRLTIHTMEESTMSYLAVNKDSVNMVAGAAVATYNAAFAAVVRASAANNTKRCIGLITDDTAQNFTNVVKTQGTFSLPDWTNVTGSAALTVGSSYYLSATTPGQLTTTPPTTSGQVVQEVGVAVSPDTLDIDPQEPILL